MAFVLVLFATGAWATTVLADGGPTGGSTGTRPAAIIYRPPGLSTAQKVPLVVALYGDTGTPQGMEGLTHFEAVADEHGFVVAYPGSLSSSGAPWQSTQDIPYIGSLIGQIETSQNIDPTRVYVAGFSAGGRFAYQLGCALSQQIAAIAIVGSVQRPYACPLSHPVSELTIAGSQEGINGFASRGIPSAYTVEGWWRQRDGCTGAEINASVAPLSEQYSGSCVDGSTVGLFIVQGGTHTWPGCCGLPASNPDSQWNASEGIWSFFSAHSTGSLTTPVARLTTLRSTLSGHTRRVTETFTLGEAVTVTQTLTGRGHQYAPVTSKLPAGAGLSLRLSVSRSAKPGSYTVALQITDAYGRSTKLVRKIQVAKLPKPKPHKPKKKAK